MAQELDFWTPTVQVYSQLQLPSPELNEKLLRRPPLRFIHDIVAAINTRFAAYDHVVSKEHVDYAGLDTKEKKIDYLEAIIKYVDTLLGAMTDVSAAKIVAGKEPEKTNAFLRNLALAVGFAQQDKAKRDKEEKKAKKEKKRKTPTDTGVPPPPPPPPLPPAIGEARKSRGSADGNTSMFAQSDSLPHRDSLPRRKSSAPSSPVRQAANQKAIANAATFNCEITGYQLNLGPGGGDIRSDGQKMVTMWQELQHPKVDTTPATMPEESLEIAIKRQTDALRQFQALMEKNDKVIDELENLILQ